MNIAFAAYFSYIEKFCAYSSVLPCPWGFSGQEPGVGYPVLLQRISPGLNPVLLHSRQILYHLSPHGSPRTMEWVVYPFSRGTSRPRNWTRVSCIAGRFFTIWVPMGVQEHWSGWSIPSPGELPDPGIEPGSPALQADSLPAELPGKPSLHSNVKASKSFSFLPLF